jgi:hypothetical protein
VEPAAFRWVSVARMQHSCVMSSQMPPGQLILDLVRNQRGKVSGLVYGVGVMFT